MTDDRLPRSSILRSVARWWVQAYEAVGLPARQEIDLPALRHTLPFLWLVDYLPVEDEFYYRLAGEHINDNFGFSLRGKRLSEIIEPRLLDVVRQRFLHTLNGPGAVHARGRVYARTGGHREGERLILPLSDDRMTARTLLGVTDYGTNIHRSSDWTPPEYMDECFLTLADVLAWRQSLETEEVRPGRATV